MNLKSADDTVKMAYLAGLYAGLQVNRSRYGKKKMNELKQHADTGAMCAFGDGMFSPMPVWDALIYFDLLFEKPEFEEGD